MPVWTLTLRDPARAGRARLELAAVPVQVGPQLRDRRVLGADLADLATDADRDAVRLERPDQGGQFGRPPVVLVLLLVDVGLRQVDERRGIDVDVAVPGVDREAAGAPDLLGHRLLVGGVLLGVELVVVALDEDRTPPAGRDRAGQHRRRVVDRALEGVRLLAPRELEDDRADIGRGGRLVDRPRHVEDLGPQVDGRDGEAGHLAAGPGVVQRLDARGQGTELLARLPDEPLRAGGGGLVVAERRGPGEVADAGVAEGGLVIDDQALAVEVGGAGQRGEQVGRRGRDVGHRGRVSCGVHTHGSAALRRPTPMTGISGRA